jgi:hypothetical protein
MTETGHEDQFPVPGTSARYGFRKETITGTRGNDEDAPFSAIPVANHLPPSRVAMIAGTTANHCRSQINDGSESDIDLR